MLLVACAGNPPEWWNPSGRYSQTASQQTAAATSAAKPAATRTKPVVKEEALDPLPDNSYEEETLAPLPEEEDTPAVDAITEPALDGNNALNGNGGLPAPSVLE